MRISGAVKTIGRLLGALVPAIVSLPAGRILLLAFGLGVALAPPGQAQQPAGGVERSGAIDLAADNADSLAIIIGNRHYRQTVPVDFAHNDAEAMAAYLVKGLGFRPGNVSVLKDATLSELTQVFGSERSPQGRLFNRAVEGRSNVFVFFAGHGVPDFKTRQPYILPADGDPNQPESGYALETLYRNLDLVKQKVGAARQVVVMIDACFTGETGRKGESLLAVSAPGFAPARPRGGGGLVRLAATSGATPANWDEGLKLSLFTSRFLMGVSGLAAKPGTTSAAASSAPSISWAELATYLRDEVGEAARRTSGRDQVPEIDPAPLRLAAATVPAVEGALAGARDEAAWRAAEAENTRAAFERYVARCGTVCAYREAALAKVLAEQRGAALARDEESWKTLSTQKKFGDYLKSCAPICAYKALAERYLAAANPDFDPRVKACDERAAAEADLDRPQAVTPTPTARMNARAAIAACGEAVAAFPDNRRLLYQLGRAHDALDDYAKALPAYRAAADKGSAAALNNLATLYENGTGVPASLPEAVKLYRRGAELGHKIAMSNLARMAEYGRGMPASKTEAAKWYARAAEKGDLFSNTKYANFMIEKVPGVPAEPMAALLKLQKSIDGGEPMAMVTFATMIDRGLPMQNFTSRTSIDLLRGALKDGETGAEAILVPSIFAALKPASRLQLQRDAAQAGFYSGPVDGRLTPDFAHALRQHARKLAASP